MPGRTLVEIRQELLRLQARLHKQKPRNEKQREELAKYPVYWAESSEDEDDLFMPSIKVKSATSSKGKSVAPSKGKSVALVDEDSEDDFMPSNKGKSVARWKGKNKAM
jgi:hypothetical protein